MTDQSLIIAVAKLDGWKKSKTTELSFDNPKVEIHNDCWENARGMQARRPPDYLESRDAIIPVIEKQDVGIQILVIQEVWLQNRPTTCHVIGSSTLEILLATPKQLSIALVKATGNWEERSV